MTTKKAWPPLANGTKVWIRSVPPEAKDWTQEALEARRFRCPGVIVHYHDSHGLCYDVQHKDGTIGCYDPNELQVLKEDSP